MWKFYHRTSHLGCSLACAYLDKAFGAEIHHTATPLAIWQASPYRKNENSSIFSRFFCVFAFRLLACLARERATHGFPIRCREDLTSVFSSTCSGKRGKRTPQWTRRGRQRGGTEPAAPPSDSAEVTAARPDSVPPPPILPVEPVPLVPVDLFALYLCPPRRIILPHEEIAGPSAEAEA